jgi:hypothetical protein
MCGAIIKQLRDCLHGCLCSFGLLCGDLANSDEHSRVHSASIIQKSTQHFLHAFGVFDVQERSRVGGCSVLCSCTVVGLLPRMWGMLRACRLRMLESLERVCNISWHGEIACTILIIPGKLDATVFVAGPIDADAV